MEGSPAPTPVPLSRNRDYVLLWSGQAVSSLGSTISSLAYPLLVLSETGSPAKAGLVGFAHALPALLQLPLGVAVDRVDRRRLMLASSALRLVGVASVAAAIAAGAFWLPQILLVAFLEGTFGIVYYLSELSALRLVVFPGQVPTAFARNEARGGAAALIGQPLGGALFGLGRALPFVADALSYVVSLVALLLVRGSLQEPREGPRRHVVQEIREGVAWLWRHTFLRTCAFLVAVSNLLVSGLYLTVIVLAQGLGASPGEIGVMMACASAGGLAGALAAPSLGRRLTPRAVVVGSNWAWAALMPGFLIAPNPLALGAVFALMLFVAPLWNVVVVAYRASIVPDELQGRVHAAARTIAGGAVPLGSLVAGILLEALGDRETAFVLFVGMVLLALAGSLSRSLRVPPAVEAPA